MKRTPLIISIAITTLILITLGGVISVVQGKGAGDNSMNAVQIDEAVEKAVTERDAAYQELIDEANHRILEAQQQNQVLQEQLSDLQVQDASNDIQAGPVEASAPVQTVLVTPEQAATIAADQLGEADIYSVESGNSNGVPVYKVTFSSGTIVLVSMEGEILVVQLPAPATFASSNSSASSSASNDENYDEEDDHEGDDQYEEHDEGEQEEEHEDEEEREEDEEEHEEDESGDDND